MSQYSVRQVISAFFLAPTEALARWLPPGLCPLEARPRHGILAVTSFDFSASAVGPYAELGVSILVPPYCLKDEELPCAALYPFELATTTPAAGADASERWCLPRYRRPVEVQFRRDPERCQAAMFEDGVPMLELTVRRGQPEPSTRVYQLFTRRERQLFRVSFAIEGAIEQRDDEGGGLRLFDHPLADTIRGMLADDTPILEQSMEAGEQRFGTLTPFGGTP